MYGLVDLRQGIFYLFFSFLNVADPDHSKLAF